MVTWFWGVAHELVGVGDLAKSQMRFGDVAKSQTVLKR